MLTAEALAIAASHAARDRDTLARLLAAGTVVRDRGVKSSSFTRDIESRAFTRPKINLAIRPAKRKKR